MRVEVSDQVIAFIRGQSPEPRRRLRLALRRLEDEQGDIRSLQGPLSGYKRLRIGPYRIVFAVDGERACMRCLFAEKRDVVYGVFSDILKRRLLQE